MSGCVNCVWDLYREDLEEWAAKSAEAQARLAASSDGGTLVEQHEPKSAPDSVRTAGDDDGGGSSETNWYQAGSKTVDDLFSGIPVGIREFMKTEKSLKERHEREARANQ
jgi:hypothetical protein